MPRLGDHLVELGALSRADVEAAVLEVRQGERLGSYLVSSGIVTHDVVARALAVQHGVHAACAAHFANVDPRIVALLSPELARRHCAFPIGFVGSDPVRLAVALLNPREEAALQAVADASKYPLCPAVAPEVVIRSAIATHYSGLAPRPAPGAKTLQDEIHGEVECKPSDTMHSTVFDMPSVSMTVMDDGGSVRGSNRGVASNASANATMMHSAVPIPAASEALQVAMPAEGAALPVSSYSPKASVFQLGDYSPKSSQFMVAVGSDGKRVPPPPTRPPMAEATPAPIALALVEAPSGIDPAQLQAMLESNPSLQARDPLELHVHGTAELPPPERPRRPPVKRPAPIAPTTDGKTWAIRGFFALVVLAALFVGGSVLKKVRGSKPVAVGTGYVIKPMRVRVDFPSGWYHVADEIQRIRQEGVTTRGTWFFRGANKNNADLVMQLETFEVPISPLSLGPAEFELMLGTVKTHLRGKPTANNYIVKDIDCWMHKDRDQTGECSGTATRGKESRNFVLRIWAEHPFFIAAMFFHKADYESVDAEVSAILDSIQPTR